MRRPGDRGTFENPQIVSSVGCRNAAASVCRGVTQSMMSGFSPGGGEYFAAAVQGLGESSR